MKSWCDRYLSENDLNEIEKAVARAESGTSGEIIPILVKRSTGVAHVFYLLLLIFLSFYLFSEILILKNKAAFDAWLYTSFGTSFLSYSFEFIYALLFFVVSIFISVFLSRNLTVQRCLTSETDLSFQSEERAQIEFYQSQANKTEKRTGIIIFLSFMERKCIVLADESIANKLPPETWDQIVAQVIRGAQSGQIAQGLVQAIHSCGAILSQHFPAALENKNEISNHLIVKE